MNRKVVLTIILAGILALIAAFVILKSHDKLKPVEQTEPAEITIPVSEPEIEKVVPQEQKQEDAKPVSPQPVKKVSYKKSAPKPTAAKQPVIKPIVVKEAEPIQNSGVVQEEESKDIVITEEYKMQSPARYIFK